MSASGKVRSPWGERIEEALAGRSQAWLARAAGVSSTNLNDVIRKSMPNADTAVRLAEALQVPVQWLITGQVPDDVSQTLEDVNWMALPRFKLQQLATDDRSEPIEKVPLHRDWLTPDARNADALFVTNLPVTMPDGSAIAGDMIVCQDTTRHDREGSYLYFYRDVAMIRKYEGPSLDAVREGRPIFDWQAVDDPEMRLVARVLGVIKLRSI